MGSSISKCLVAMMALALVTASGCSTSDKVVGRYKTASCETAGSPKVSCASVIPSASAYAVSIRTPAPSSRPTGLSFPERALAAYVNALANPKMSPTATELRTNLGAPLGSGTSPSDEDIRTVFHRTIIVTVRKEGGFNPADRLEATDVTIEPVDARFDNWDTLATAYTTINAGTIQMSQARGMTESLNVAAPSGAPVSAGGSLGASQTNTRVENSTASIQTETLSATVEKNGAALVIHRQGGKDVDLTGNTVIKVDMSYTGNPLSTYIFSAQTYIDAKGKWLRPNQIALSARPVTTVPPGTAITAKVTLVYTIRHVLSGDATYEEKDDDVLELTSKPVTRTVLLIPAREASPPGFGLIETSGAYKKMAVNIARQGREAVGLCFDSYNQASDFLAYMKAANAKNPSAIGHAELGFFVPPNNQLTLLTPRELAGLQVEPRCF